MADANGDAAANPSAAADAAPPSLDQPPAPLPDRCLVAVSCTSPDLPAFLAEIKEIASSGADLVELRLDLLRGDFDPQRDLDAVMDAAKKAGLPFVVTCRAAWEGGGWQGGEPLRLATLKMAALKGAPFVDVEYKAAHMFFAGEELLLFRLFVRRRRRRIALVRPPFAQTARHQPPATAHNKRQINTNHHHPHRPRRGPPFHARHPLLPRL